MQSDGNPSRTESRPVGRLDDDSATVDQGSNELMGALAWKWLEARPLVIDLGIAAAASTAALMFEAFDVGDTGARLNLVDVLCCLLATGLIVLRRLAPWPVLAAALIAAAWSLIPNDGQPILRVAAFLALYTVSSTCSRRAAWVAGVVCASVLFVTASHTTSGSWFVADSLEQIAWMIVATAAGDAVRSRRAYRAARSENALAQWERAARAREEEADRLVIEERLRIARELHDVVAHHIAVISVQAGVAAHLLHDDPAGAEVALGHVRRGASSVLHELGSILNVMRRTGDQLNSTDPLPSLGDLDRLVAAFSASDADIDYRTSGTPTAITPSTGLAAFRIVQESLTNAHRHGSGSRVRLHTDYQPGTLVIEILNDYVADRQTGSSQGHGVIGMRERAAAAGGTIDIGPTTDGQFRVRLTLPLAGDD